MYESPGVAYESCLPGEDGDGDGMIGCNDKDCWGRCDPTCAPYATSCPEDRPRCGDGISQPVEAGYCADCP